MTSCNRDDLNSKSSTQEKANKPLAKAPPPKQDEKEKEEEEEQEPVTNREGFFVAKKAEGYYFVLERIENLRDHDKWTKYLDENSALRDSISDPLRKKYGFQAARYATTFLEKIALATVGVERDAKNIVDQYEDVEVWMAYITDLEPKYRFSWSKKAHVEMSVTVISRAHVPFQIHMGILRGLHYIKDGKALHRNTSIDLHGFIAKAVLKREPQKKFIITQPLFSMADIFEKNLDNQFYRFYSFGGPGSVWIYEKRSNPKGSQPWIIKTGGAASDSNFSLKISDRFNNEVFSVEKGDKKKMKEYDWFFSTIWFSTGSLHFIAELAYLASLFSANVTN